MGDHYVPQRFLRAFAEDDRVWIFDKLGKVTSTRTHVKNVAQETGLYPPELERWLTSAVEEPANLVLTRLRLGHSLRAEDRKPLVH